MFLIACLMVATLAIGISLGSGIEARFWRRKGDNLHHDKAPVHSSGSIYYVVPETEYAVLTTMHLAHKAAANGHDLPNGRVHENRVMS